MLLSKGFLWGIAFDQPNKENTFIPWFTGTFLAYGGVTLNPGNINVQFFTTAIDSYGEYNNRGQVFNTPDIVEYSPFFAQYQMGLFKSVDITLITQALYASSEGVSDVHWGPTSLNMSFQLMLSEKKTYKPNIRFIISGTFPSGPFDELGAEVRSIGAGTNGSYQFGPILVLQKIFYVMPKHPFSINLNGTYLYQTSAHVKEFSFYGGNSDSEGTVHPRPIWNANLAFELMLTRNVSIGSDLNYNYTGRVDYEQILGDADLSQKPSQTITITPMIEYNFNQNLGMFVSGWLSLWGQNTAAFAGGTASIAITF